MALQNFVRELKHRGVYQVAAVYAAAAWALLQVADVLFPVIGLPDEAVSFLLISAAGLFPISIFLAWVFEWTPEGIKVAESEQPAGVTKLSRWRLFEFVVLVFLVSMVGYLYWERFTLTRTISEQAAMTGGGQPGDDYPFAFNSIAVLPFASMTDQARDTYFGDGLAEEILNLLAKLNELDVAARTSSFAFRDHNIDVRGIADSLHVRHILEGSVRRNDDHIRITAQLIDAATGYHLWSETYDRKFEDIFQIQDDIAQKVTRALQLILSRDSARMLQSTPTDNLEAYDYYLQARDYMRRPYAETTLDSALSLLDLAIKLDPKFAAARASRCSALLSYYKTRRMTEYFISAERACYAALSLDAGNAEVYTALGELYLASGQMELSETQLRKAIELDPENVDAPLALAVWFAANGRDAESLAELDKLLERRPRLWQAHYHKGITLFEIGESEKAVAPLSRAVELSPDNQQAYNALGGVYFMLGQFDASSAAFSISIALEPTTFSYSNIGTSYFYASDFQQAAAMYEKALEMAPEDYELWGNLAEAQWFAGLGDQARNNYEQAIALAFEVLKVNPEDAVVMAHIGLYNARLGRPEEAVSNTAQALAQLPVSMMTQYGVAWTYTALKDYPAATEALKQAIDLGYPTNLVAADPALSILINNSEAARLLIEQIN